MLNFKQDFYEKIFQSLDNNSVLMRVEEDGTYYPIWCSREFTEMMEGTEEEFIRLESGGTMSTIHPDDREAVAYLFKHHTTKDGTNNLTIRKQTGKGNELWVNVHYAFVTEDGVQYAYCTYTDVTELKESQAQALAMYEELDKELTALADDSLAAIRSNLTRGVVEEVRGTDLYDVDKPGASMAELLQVRMDHMPLASDRELYLKTFDFETLKERYYLGEGPASLVIFSRRQSGRQCFIRYSASMRKDPATGDVIVLGVEREYNSEKVTEVLNDKVLAKQYDMVSYIVNGNYGVVIGDAANIKTGNLFPKQRDGVYMDYIRDQVIPAASEKEHDRGELLRALSPETIGAELETNESYTVDVTCDIDGEIFNKRFMFYLVDQEAKFYILLKSDVTDVLREQQERNEQEQTRTVYKSMLDQFNAMADASLTVQRTNLTTGVIEEARGRDLYPTDHAGGSIVASAQIRAESFLLEGDRESYEETFAIDRLLERSHSGAGPAIFVGYCRRYSGRQCFVRFSGSASRNPVTGDIIAFGVETEYNAEMVNKVLDEKVLAQQYDMITYIVSGYYGVAIGDGASIKKGSIFPKERNGVYMDYIQKQVMPVVMGTEEEKAAMLHALDFATIEAELAEHEPYTVDVTCEIGGEVFYKRFMFYAVDREAKFYLLLKSDVTDVLREQQERNELLADALQEAERANMAKTAFLSSMSHEIRTPMNAIIGLDNIALKDPELPGRTREHLEKIGGSARHLLSLINDILDMSRIESGRMTLRNEAFSFTGMLEQINTMIGSQCQDKSLTYKCEVPAQVDEYYIGDDMKLKQVLINILGNAVKFTPAPGTVSLLVERTARFEDKSTLRFLIKDTGIGMDKEYLPKIFEPFSQEDETKANKYGSTGLGMAITKNIVEMMNGTIAVESEKGVGSVFTVTVTLTSAGRTDAPDRDEEANQKTEETAKTDLNGRRILLAEDIPINAEIMAELLDMRGMKVDHAENGQLAVKLFAESPEGYYDAVLMDVQMPVLDGLGAAKAIRALPRPDAGRVPIIAMTANAFDEDVQRSLQAGMNAHLSKPVEPAHLYETLETLIRDGN